MWYVILTGVLLVFLVVALHHMVLNALTGVLAKVEKLRGYFVVLAIFCIIFTHFIEVILFAIGFYLGTEYAGVGVMKGEFGGDFREYIYFSLVSYTSLGLGDVYPYGAIRLLTGLEALTGLIMIGWSATFTYLMMSRIWDKSNISQ